MDPETRAGILDGRIGATEPIVLLRMTPDPAAPTPSTEALVAASSTRSARSAEINWGNTEVVATVSTDTPVAIKVPSGDFDRLGLNFYKNGDRMFISDIKKAVAEINAPELRWGMQVQ